MAKRKRKWTKAEAYAAFYNRVSGEGGRAGSQVLVSARLGTPKCFLRGCRHFRGVRLFGDDEHTERNVCDAFPDGIPDEIAYGDNPHTEPYPGDHGMRYLPPEE